MGWVHGSVGWLVCRLDVWVGRVVGVWVGCVWVGRVVGVCVGYI